ncbi:MAG: helix-turn-helix domain-containing protein [Bryobacteraceae bacterium]
MVRYREIRPPVRLRSFINSFWILEHDGEDDAPQRVVPDGQAELILNWGEPFQAFQDGRWEGQPRCFLAGQIDGPLLLRPAGPAKMLGIGFRPHGAACVFREPMHELSGCFTPLEDLSQSLSRSLSNAMESPDPIAAVEAALLSAQGSSRGVDLLMAQAVRRIIFEKGATDLASLARELGLSIRQLERRFLAVVGLPPKLFCRIQRFNNVFHVLGQHLEQPSRNWVDTAVACGYYDQAHLIRDCKSLSGSTPATLLAADADLARHFYQRYGVSRAGAR